MTQPTDTNRCPATNPATAPEDNRCTKTTQPHTTHVDQTGGEWT